MPGSYVLENRAVIDTPLTYTGISESDSTGSEGGQGGVPSKDQIEALGHMKVHHQSFSA